MWEQLKIYKRLEKKEINPAFKKLGSEIVAQLENYSTEQTSSMIKIFRVKNNLEQGVFIGKSPGSYDIKVNTCIKPVDFYQRHRFTMLNIVPLGDILHNHHRTSYPLTQEWKELAIFITSRIKNEIEIYFDKYDSYEKIISNRKEIEPKDFGLDNKYELLIYAAIKTKNGPLLDFYIDKKISKPVMQISKSEFLKPDKQQFNEIGFLQKIKLFGQNDDFDRIEKEIAMLI